MSDASARIGLLTVSDRAHKGEYEDRGGPAMRACLEEFLTSPFDVVAEVVPDEQPLIEDALVRMSDAGCALIVTTGGTGPARRDVTVEATLAVCQKPMPGFGELMRRVSLEKVPTAILSRQEAGIRFPDDGPGSLIVNLPGSPKAIRECLIAVFPAIPYCVDLIDGPYLETDAAVVEGVPTEEEVNIREIRVRGAQEHNLQGIDVDIPRDQLVVITGLSGSGKSSLAFDTIFAEGQRKYMESLSAYARQFLDQLKKPDVESIEGLPPTIAIEQRSGGHNPRSTVATSTEIQDYLRLLFARAGEPRCWGADEGARGQGDRTLRASDRRHLADADHRRRDGGGEGHQADGAGTARAREEGLPQGGDRGPGERRLRARAHQRDHSRRPRARHARGKPPRARPLRDARHRGRRGPHRGQAGRARPSRREHRDGAQGGRRRGRHPDGRRRWRLERAGVQRALRLRRTSRGGPRRARATVVLLQRAARGLHDLRGPRCDPRVRRGTAAAQAREAVDPQRRRAVEAQWPGRSLLHAPAPPLLQGLRHPADAQGRRPQRAGSAPADPRGERGRSSGSRCGLGRRHRHVPRVCSTRRTRPGCATTYTSTRPSSLAPAASGIAFASRRCR